MISALEALRLPTAQLSDEERAAVDGLLILIDEMVRKGMSHNGIDLTTKMTNKNVIAAVNQRLRAVGWVAQWQPMIEQHRLNTAVQNHVGFHLSLFPTDETYAEAIKATLQ